MIVTAQIKFDFDFSESIDDVNRERSESGEPKLTEKEIKDWVIEGLETYNFNECPEVEVFIK